MFPYLLHNVFCDVLKNRQIKFIWNKASWSAWENDLVCVDAWKVHSTFGYQIFLNANDLNRKLFKK